MGTEATTDSGEGVRTLQHKIPTTFGEHTARHRQGKPRLLLCPKEVPGPPGAQIHKQSYYSRPREVTETPMGQGTGRGRKGCPRLPFELLEGSEVNRTRTRKAKAPAEATRRNILMALFWPLLKVLWRGSFYKWAVVRIQ